MNDEAKYCTELLRDKRRCDLACMAFDSEGEVYFDFDMCDDSKFKKMKTAEELKKIKEKDGTEDTP